MRKVKLKEYEQIKSITYNEYINIIHKEVAPTVNNVLDNILFGKPKPKKKKRKTKSIYNIVK